MSWEIWTAYLVATTVLLAIPGPTVILVVSYALGHGRSSGWATVPGVTLGDLTAMTVSLLGAGAVLAASATLFTILKIVGAAYLIWLGIALWRADPQPETLDRRGAGLNRWRMFRNAFVVTALNPKGIVFFVAFLPQFVNPVQPALPQFVIMGSTFLVLAAINVALWAVLAGQLRRQIRKPRILRIVNRVGGSFMIGAGLVTALARRI